LTIQLRGANTKDAPVVGKVQLYTKSYALVIGINDYRNGWPRLSMAVKNAKKIAEELDARGFDVSLKINPNSAQLKNAFEDFLSSKAQIQRHVFSCGLRGTATPREATGS
jgi:hypothetical protein